MSDELIKALNDHAWIGHRLGDAYSMLNVGGKVDKGLWKIVYYPMFGDWKGEGEWVDFGEPRALIESKLENGTDFRTVPLRYLIKIQ